MKGRPGKDRTDSILKKSVTILCAIVTVIIVVVAFGYVRYLNRIVTDNTVAQMRELALRGKETTASRNELYWELLTQLHDRVRKVKCDTVTGLCERLNLESATRYYDGVCLVADNGRTYSGAYLVRDGNDREEVKRILGGEARFAVKYFEDTVTGRERDSLVYGISFEPFEVGGVTFVGMYAVAEADSLENSLKLESFGGEGCSLVIDTQGYYLYKRDVSVGIANRRNFFDELVDLYGYTPDRVAGIRSELAERKSFCRSFRDAKSEDILIYFEFIEDTDWTLLLTVPEAVVNLGSRRFVQVTGIMMAIVIAVLVAMMCIIIRMYSGTLGARSEAKARAEFLSTMSHEIRTPLNGIMGLNHLMQSSLDDKDKMREYLDKSLNTEQYLLTLVNDVLDVQKLQAGRMEIVNEPFSLKTLIEGTVDLMHDRMQAKQIAFVTETDIVRDGVVGDPVRIRQILINIIGNAHKFTDAGGRVTFTVSQQPGLDGRVLTRFSVEDNGCGMSREFQKVIFESFSQDRTSTQTSIKGTGLGMNISYLLAVQMGGDLSVVSEQGVGSTFTLKLELPVAEGPVKAATPDREKVAGNPIRKMNILVAEDNEINAEILTELLKDAGHSVTVATDGVEVAEVFAASEAGEFDLILMDVLMPRRNGYEASKLIRAMDRADARTVPIFACTANAFREDELKAREAGMDDFITKPIDVKKMMEKLERIV